MHKDALAQELRERQYAAGYVDRETIHALAADAVIDAYLTCSCCGVVQVTRAQRHLAIAMAHDSESFLALCDHFGRRTH